MAIRNEPLKSGAMHRASDEILTSISNVVHQSLSASDRCDPA